MPSRRIGAQAPGCTNANHGLGKGCNTLKIMAREKQTEDILVQKRQSQVSLEKYLFYISSFSSSIT
jgi:hypothetical protein